MTWRFEPLAEHHLALLHGWLLRPHAARWWGPAEPVDVLRADYLDAEAARTGALRACIAHLDDAPLGFIQSYTVMGAGGSWWEDSTDPGARGIDQFLADPQALGQGLGRRMIRAYLATLFADPTVTVVQTDPHPDNARAIRCYAAVGFTPVGPVDTPDGPALLMRCTRASLAAAAPA